MTELESARKGLADIRKRTNIGPDLAWDRVSNEEVVWLCDQLSGFLSGETLKNMEKEFSDLKSLKERNDNFMYREWEARTGLQETVKRLEAKQKELYLHIGEATRERDRLRAQLAVADETIRQWNLQAIQSVEQAVAAERERIMQLLRGPKDRGAFPVITIRKEGEEEG